MSWFRTTRPILVPGLVALVLASLPAGARSIPALPTPERLIDGEFASVGPPDDAISVHADSTGRVVVLAIERRGLEAYLSEDGLTYAPGAHVAGTVEDRPVFAAIAEMDDAGSVHALLLEGREGGYGLAHVRGDDAGRNWTPVRSLTGPGDGTSRLGRRSMFLDVRMALGPNGRVAVGWTGRPEGFWVTVSGDSGDTWSAPRRLDTPAEFGDYHGLDLAFTGDGTLVYVYSQGTDPLPQSVSPLVVRVSDDLGATFTEPTLLEPNYVEATYVSAPRVEPAADGGVLVFGAGERIVASDLAAVVYRSSDGGRTFARAFVELRSGLQPISDVVHAFSAPDGRVVFVFEDGRRSFRIAASTDHGSTFPWVSSMVGVRADLLIGGSFSAAPLENGRWMLGGETGQSQGPARYFALRSDDGGATWTPYERLGADRLIVRGERTDVDGGLAALPGGHVVAAFRNRDDESVYDSDVYVSRFDADSAAWAPSYRIDDDGPPVTAITGRMQSVAAGGRIWVGRGGPSLVVQRSDDGGRNYTDPVEVSETTSVSGASAFQLAADELGNVHVSWGEFDPTTFRTAILYATSRDAGATWTAPAAVVPDVGFRGLRGLRLLAAGDGSAWIVWSDGLNPRVLGISGDGAVVDNRTPTRPVSPPVIDFEACLAGDRLYLLEIDPGSNRYFVRVLEPGATGFEDRIQIDDAFDGSTNIDMACLPDGRASFAWMEPVVSVFEGNLVARDVDGTQAGPLRTLDTGIDRSSIVSCDRCEDAAATIVTYGKEVRSGGTGDVDRARWATRLAGDGSPVRIDGTSDTPAALDHQFTSVVAEDGRAWIAWTESPEAGGIEQVVTVRSDDGGRTWGPVRRIGTATPDRVHGEREARVHVVTGGAAFLFLGRRPTDLYQAYTNIDRVNAPPVADAGPDLRLECEDDLAATATLDGSGSSDPDGADDLASWNWSTGDEVVAEGEVASAAFPLGSTEVTLTVTDRAGATGIDVATIVVEDSIAPAGGIAFPGDGTCHPGDVTVETDFADACDPDLDIAFDPTGPTFVEHGDHTVTATATDEVGNASPDSVTFTIDRIAPVVSVLADDLRSLLPSDRPLASVFTSVDDDGATGDVVHETLALAGCTIYDGAIDGDRDGLLSDETIVLDLAEVCRLAARCAWSVLESPELVAEATDCAGNVGRDARILAGSLRLLPGVCAD